MAKQAIERYCPTFAKPRTLPASTMNHPNNSSISQLEKSSGIIEIEGDKVVWHNKNVACSTFKISDVLVIGEHTNSNGPWFDDWFIDFVTKDGQWHSIPWNAENIDELTNILCNDFIGDLNTSYLSNSTVWNSIVRFPARLKGQQLFILTPSKNYKAPLSLFDKLLMSFGLGHFNTTQDICLLDEVKAELRSASR